MGLQQHASILCYCVVGIPAKQQPWPCPVAAVILTALPPAALELLAPRLRLAAPHFRVNSPFARRLLVRSAPVLSGLKVFGRDRHFPNTRMRAGLAPDPGVALSCAIRTPDSAPGAGAEFIHRDDDTHATGEDDSGN